MSTGGAAVASATADPSSSSSSSQNAPSSTPAPESATTITSPAAAGTATYYPSGPQQNVPQADLTGWELCYTDLYGTPSAPIYGAGGVLDELCTGDYLLLAGAPVGSTTLTLLAAAPRTDVLFVTPQDSETVHVANGSGWYFNDDYSWGFLLEGDIPDKDECDVRDDGAVDLRLCWHVFGQELTGGYRLGSVEDLNDSQDYARFIYHAADIAAPAPAPEELAATGTDLPVATAVGLGGLTLVAGALIVVVATRRRSGGLAHR